VDWDGNVVWRGEVPYQSHDFFPMENGHILYPASSHPKAYLPDDLTIKWRGGRPGTECEGKIHGEMVFEIDRDSKIVWEWNSYEHMDPETDDICPLENRNHFHGNAVWKCRDGSVLLSLRYNNEVLKIDFPSGKILRRYGKGKVFHIHDCRELENGNILIFDNGAHRHTYELAYSRSVEIDPKSDEIVWEYKADPPSDFYCPFMGANQRLPNSNTLITDSSNGRIFEVTKDGEIVWEYVSPFITYADRQNMYVAQIFRAHRYHRDYAAFSNVDLDPAKYIWENKCFGPGAFTKDFAPCIH
jgi:hypothetical protein